MISLFLGLIALTSTIAHGNPVESTHLVTMRKAEMMEIIDCISKAKNPELCDKFAACEKLMPQQVLLASDVCKKECAAGGWKKCSHHAVLFESHEVPLQIFDCIVKTSHKLNAEESKKMVDFEKCIRDLHVTSCKFPKHLPLLP